jgi:hypothetical protein
MLNGSMIPRTVRRLFDQRAETRDPSLAQTAILSLRGRDYPVEIVNISPSGAMIAFGRTPHIGERINLQLADRAVVEGSVCWVRDGKIGINFFSPME